MSPNRGRRLYTYHSLLDREIKRRRVCCAVYVWKYIRYIDTMVLHYWGDGFLL